MKQIVKLQLLMLFIFRVGLAVLAGQTSTAKPPTNSGCAVYFNIESAPHALTDWLYTRQVRWRYGVVQPWVDGLKRAKLSLPTADEVTIAHDKLQQEIASFRPPEREADAPPSTSYKPVQYWPFDGNETAKLENWIEKEGLRKFPTLCLSAEHPEYILAIAMAKGGVEECGYTPRGLCGDFNYHSPAILLYDAHSIATARDLSASTPEEFYVLGPMFPGDPLERAKRLITPTLKYLMKLKQFGSLFFIQKICLD